MFTQYFFYPRYDSCNTVYFYLTTFVVIYFMKIMFQCKIFTCFLISEIDYYPFIENISFSFFIINLYEDFTVEINS